MMEKLYITLITLLAIVLIHSCGAEYSDDEDNFSSNDHQTLFRYLQKTFRYYFRSNIVIAQSYTWEKYQQDWEDLENGGSLEYLHFFHTLVWVGISKTVILILEWIKILLNYIKQKCDKYLGRSAQLQPWNIMMEKSQQSISFLVFVFGTIISLISFQLLSRWNFMVFMAICFLVYSLGGPQMVLMGLVCLTAFFWFLVDIFLLYPLQTAIFIIALYVLSYLWRFLPSWRRTYPDVQDYCDRGHAHNPQKDLQSLTSRIEGMERMIDMLNKRLDRFTLDWLNSRDFNTEDKGIKAICDK